MNQSLRKAAALLLAGTMTFSMGFTAMAEETAQTADTEIESSVLSDEAVGGAVMTNLIGEGVVVNLEGKESSAGVCLNLDHYLEQAKAKKISSKTQVKMAKLTDKKASVLKYYKKIGIADVNKTNYLNVRKKPSTGAKVVGKMTNYDVCDIVATTKNGKWYKIKSGKVTGYVYASFIITGTKAELLAIEKAVKLAVCSTSSDLNVRKKPSQNSKVLTKISKNERYEVVKAGKNWVKISLGEDDNGKTQYGYIARKYCKIRYDLYTAEKYQELSADGTGVSTTRVSLSNYATQFVGNPYVWGGTSLTNGADCSGFTMSVFAKYGIYLPHSAAAQAGMGVGVSASELQPGDLVFYGSGYINHVAIYIGGGMIVHAANPRRGIVINSMTYMTPVRYRRVLNN